MSTSRIARGSSALRTVSNPRCLHSSASVAAKRKGKAELNDMFTQAGSGPKVRESYTFGGGGGGAAALAQLGKEKEREEATAAAAAAADKAAARAAKQGTPEQVTARALRRTEFDSQMAYARRLLRSEKHWEKKLVRRGVLRKLVALSDEPEQLRNVGSLFPDWALAGYTLDDSSAEDYIGRCVHFKKPQMAVTLLLNAHKYKFHLPNINTARKLLASLVENGSTLKNTLSYASIWNAYSLPAAISDGASIAMLLRACVKDGSPEALAIGIELANMRGNLTKPFRGTSRDQAWFQQLEPLSAQLETLSASA